MFSLLQGLWKYLFQKDEYFVLIIGLDNAGKTTLFEQLKRKYCLTKYVGIPFEKIAPTVGMNMGKIDLKTAVLVLWDLGGQNELQSLWSKYFSDCHGIIYVIDSSDTHRFEESYKCFSSLILDEQLKGVPLLVLSNKRDKANSVNSEAIKNIFNHSSHNIGRRDCMLHEVSALKGEGITEGIEWMLQCVKRNVVRPPKHEDII
ncbi:ADP-ribosylation factor-related protein 1 isoform X2 [Hydra vulgaris]|uniref:ADP-ribosylation factor-related protein 1 n=1 Tax=Hydra vulgaris TaxID=6087 RepID=A0ABM4CKM6_HYDVU